MLDKKRRCSGVSRQSTPLLQEFEQNSFYCDERRHSNPDFGINYLLTIDVQLGIIGLS